VTTFIGAPGVWTNYVPEANRVNAVTTSKQTITIPVSTVGATLNGFEKLSFEFGTQFTNFETGNEFVAIDNVVLKEGATVAVVVVYFLALLELARESLLDITQAEPYAPIYVRLSYASAQV
jgi:chromatin segregation and condensation protein Rec8/ScpA/Scc1 (kleisin family)